jgi:N-acyl-D-aspartate/D-glutamate deacylase
MLPLAALSFLFQVQSFDIVIRHAHIVDGSGNPWYQGDIGTKGDTITAIGILDARLPS